MTIKTRLVSSLLTCVALSGAAFAVENADLLGTWTLDGGFSAAVRTVAGERFAVTGTMTFNEDGSCMLGLTSPTGDLAPTIPACGESVCVPCTYTVGPARRFDINWDDAAVDSLANQMTQSLLGVQSEGASTDLEIERSSGLYRPALGKIRIETVLKGATTIPVREETRRFRLGFLLTGHRPL